MPQNCSRDVSRVIEHVDRVLLHGSAAAKRQLKDAFGLAVDDALIVPVVDWQARQLYTGYIPFYRFCDTVEGVVNGSSDNATGPSPLPGPNGVGLEKALHGYAAYAREYFDGFCARSYPTLGYAQDDRSCLDWHKPDQPVHADRTLRNDQRTFRWLLCHEPLAYWFDGPPPGRTPLASRTLTPEHWWAKCALSFPDGGGKWPPLGRSVARTNAYTGGWDAPRDPERLLYVNGDWDAWHTASVVSEFRPGGPLKGTPRHPVITIQGGGHGGDNYLPNALADEGAAAAVREIVATHKGWIDEFYRSKGIARPI